QITVEHLTGVRMVDRRGDLLHPAGCPCLRWLTLVEHPMQIGVMQFHREIRAIADLADLQNARDAPVFEPGRELCSRQERAPLFESRVLPGAHLLQRDEFTAAPPLRAKYDPEPAASQLVEQ